MAPVQAVVREQRRGEGVVERKLLQALIHAPELLERVRADVAPSDFRDSDCRALAEWLWGAEPGLPDDGPAAALARDLASASNTEDWAAEAAGAMLRMRERKLRQRKKEILLELQKHGAESGITELQREDQAIAEALAGVERALQTSPGARQIETEGGPWR